MLSIWDLARLCFAESSQNNMMLQKYQKEHDEEVAARHRKQAMGMQIGAIAGTAGVGYLAAPAAMAATPAMGTAASGAGGLFSSVASGGAMFA
mgnify:CR=1 FL=1